MENLNYPFTRMAKSICFSLPAAVLLACLLFSCSTGNGPDTREQALVEGKKHLILMHPTVQNLERIIFLKESGIFTLPDDYHISGIYHEDATYDYTASGIFLEKGEVEGITLFGVDTKISEGEIFTQNSLTGFFNEAFTKSDGILFMGGPDIPPSAYGEEFNLLTVVTDPYRHYFELSFLYHLIGRQNDRQPLLETREDYLILGICLGMQSMNVAAGGKLIQDIPTEVYQVYTVEEVLALDPEKQHRNYNSYYRLDPRVSTASFHSIRIADNSHLGAIAGNGSITPHVLSSHHQAVVLPDEGFRATAWSADGKIIESIEHEMYPNVIGVQFHPEVDFLYDPEHNFLMEAGGSAAGSYAELYPGELGEDFHNHFWYYISSLLPQR